MNSAETGTQTYALVDPVSRMLHQVRGLAPLANGMEGSSFRVRKGLGKSLLYPYHQPPFSILAHGWHLINIFGGKMTFALLTTSFCNYVTGRIPQSTVLGLYQKNESAFSLCHPLLRKPLSQPLWSQIFFFLYAEIGIQCLSFLSGDELVRFK